MRVKDIMRRDIKTVSPEENVREGAKLMKKFNVGSLLVVKDSDLLGIVTENDIIEKVVAEGKNANTMKMKDIMTENVIVIDPEADIEEAAATMVKYNIKKLPVLIDKVLVGIVTATDIMAAEPRIMEEIEGFVLLAKKRTKIAG
ncbi:MAG TPA: CBS domain-containing protein [Candidatus Aenigmarchaeota archaeon]|nr:MAG: CBS domain-containing protein [Candidatus Aenigmarchaeota archaeon]HDD46515.1 CBS domain-containing protein [Candidatus Aenigmarchaeota archaeon]